LTMEAGCFLAIGQRPIVEFNLEHMEASHSSPGRRFCAWGCLAALVLLWSPLWAAAWQAARTDCCAGGMCPAHRRTNQNHYPQPSLMPCDHHGGDGISKCSVSCCQSEAHTFVASTTFLLAPQLQLSPSLLAVSALNPDAKREILPPTAPPDHPPRLLPS
jgi:hypothetical protein